MRNFLLAMSIYMDGEQVPMNHTFSAPQLTMSSLELGIQGYLNEIVTRARMRNPEFSMSREDISIINVIELDPTYDEDEEEDED